MLDRLTQDRIHYDRERKKNMRSVREVIIHSLWRHRR
jgi:hypothetical protein